MKKGFIILLFLFTLTFWGCGDFTMEPGILVKTSNPYLKSGYRSAQYMDNIYYSDKNQIIKQDANGQIEEISVQDAPTEMTVCDQGIFVYHESLSSVTQYDYNGDVISQIEEVADVEQLHATNHGLYLSAFFRKTGNTEIIYYDEFQLDTPPEKNILDETKTQFQLLSDLIPQMYKSGDYEMLPPQCYKGPDGEILIIKRRDPDIGLDEWGLLSKNGIVLSDSLYLNYFIGINQETVYELGDKDNEPVYIIGNSKNGNGSYTLPEGFLYSDTYLTENQRIVVLGSKWKNNGRHDIYYPIQYHQSDILVEIDLNNDSVTSLLTTAKQERILTYSGKYVYCYSNGKVIRTDLSNNSSEALYNFGSRKNIEFETCGGWLFAHSTDGTFLFKTQILADG